MQSTRKDNYRKYTYVRNKLIEFLEDGVSAKITTKELRISLPTFYKYKSIASIETGKIYTVQEEQAFIDREARKEEKFWLRNQKNWEKIHGNKTIQTPPATSPSLDKTAPDTPSIQDKAILPNDAVPVKTPDTPTHTSDNQPHKKANNTSVSKEQKK
jgi:hypothetical protein